MVSEKKIPCSVPILTLNSELYLEECLESVKDFEDVYLVDGNSTDSTLEIADRHNIPVYKQVETDEPEVRISDFSAMRIRAYSFAKTKWIFDLDSDEYLSRELVDEIRGVFAKEVHKKVSFKTTYLLKYRKQIVYHAFSYPNYRIRLHHKQSGAGYDSNKKVHEVVVVPDDVKVVSLHHPVISYGMMSYADSVNKDRHYLSLVHNKFFGDKNKKTQKHSRKIVFAVFRSYLRCIKILVISFWYYARYGYQKSLPLHQVLRHVRYHFVLGNYRVKQLFNNFFAY